MSDFSRASRRIVSSIASEPGNNNGGSELAINNPNSIARKQDLQALKRQTGGLKRFPVLHPSNELLSHARKSVFKTIREDKTIKNGRQRARKLGAEKMDALTKAMCVPIRDVVKGYKTVFKSLHPFEAVVADLTVKAREKKDGMKLELALDELNDGRKKVLDLGKGWANKIKNAPTAREAESWLVQAEEEMATAYKEEVGPKVDGLLELQKALRKTPSVVLDTPACVLVGAPNVGKSSIVKAISSGTPEISNYPFTTRGMTLGHISQTYKNGLSEQCQVMDSPGLLWRADERRNEMEQLTIAAMAHLPTAVVFVMDLSGQAGDACSSVEDQLKIRKQVRDRFPRRPWVDVLAKYDLGVEEDVREELNDLIGEDAANNIVELSVHEGWGVDDLRKRVEGILKNVRTVLDVIEAEKQERRREEEEEVSGQDSISRDKS
ncbi:hypothetical protein TrCOL_g5759 [Triparma columacea]|uniref:Nucleolar GTP-binding protein 1 n=1 Tax=Triparma columacea TaxID=722753 RepID=A0A9W7L2A5_9STRA|nr:hypothetical protein TrCOL_g5759 [Triparma columacea]